MAYNTLKVLTTCLTGCELMPLCNAAYMPFDISINAFPAKVKKKMVDAAASTGAQTAELAAASPARRARERRGRDARALLGVYSGRRDLGFETGAI